MDVGQIFLWPNKEVLSQHLPGDDEKISVSTTFPLVRILIRDFRVRSREY